jgi:hypothetical protein
VPRKVVKVTQWVLMALSPLLSSHLCKQVPAEYCRGTNETPRFLYDEFVSDDASFRVCNAREEKPAKQQTAVSVTPNCRSMFIMNNGDRIYICNGCLEEEKKNKIVNNLYIIHANSLSTSNS